MKIFFFPFGVAGLVVAAFMIGPPPANAQVMGKVQVRVAGAGGGGRMLFGGGRLSSSDPDQIALFLEMRVEQMRVVCGLSDSQCNKLKLAGKSAARKLLARKPKNLPLAGFGRGAAMDVQPDSLSDEDEENAGDGDDKEDSAAFPLQSGTSLREVTDQKLWKKAMTSLLSEDQRRAWTEFTDRETGEIRRAVVDRHVAELRQSLCLHPDQIEAVSRMVDRVDGDRLVQEFLDGGGGLAAVGLGQGNSNLTEEDWDDVLSEVQMKVWRTRNAPSGLGGLLGNLLGVDNDADDDGDETFGVEFEGDRGLVVELVRADSMADALGVREGDVIDSVDGEPVDTRLQFRRAFESASGVASVTVLRGDELLELKAS